MHNANVKALQNYPIIATAAENWTIDGLGGEDVGYCDATPPLGTFGSSSCPSPYDSVKQHFAGRDFAVWVSEHCGAECGGRSERGAGDGG